MHMSCVLFGRLSRNMRLLALTRLYLGLFFNRRLSFWGLFCKTFKIAALPRIWCLCRCSQEVPIPLGSARNRSSRFLVASSSYTRGAGLASHNSL